MLTPFPLARRRQLVAATISGLVACRGSKARQRLWDKTIADLRQQLLHLDIGKVEIDRQLLAFHNAVSSEMLRQLPTDGRQRPGGAA